MLDRSSVGMRPRFRRRAFLLGVGVIGAGALVACSGGSAGTTPSSSAAGSSAAAPATPTIQMTNDNKFSPATLTVPKGTSVTWQNASTMVHSATDDPAKAVNTSDAVLPEGAPPRDSGFMQPVQSC